MREDGLKSWGQRRRVEGLSEPEGWGLTWCPHFTHAAPRWPGATLVIEATPAGHGQPPVPVGGPSPGDHLSSLARLAPPGEEPQEPRRSFQEPGHQAGSRARVSFQALPVLVATEQVGVQKKCLG